jgi:hypothetical protein
MTDRRVRLLVRAWLLTGVVDGLFSSVLSVAAYGSTVTRLFQGVASVLLGPDALQGGLATALVGLPHRRVKRACPRQRCARVNSSALVSV